MVLQILLDFYPGFVKETGKKVANGAPLGNRKKPAACAAGSEGYGD
jgi:hypothetical protein